MHIQPADPATGYPPKRHTNESRPQSPDGDALPEGLIRGRIDALLPDGQVRVSVAGRMIQFMPPRAMMPGEWIHLKVTARTPQLMLQIADTAGESVADLSAVAALIGKLSAPGAPRPGLIAVAGPLLASHPVNSTVVAAQLARTVADSGLFYESHQAQWVDGGRTLAQLAAEPQFRLGPSPAPATPPESPDGGGAMTGGAAARAPGATDAHPEALLLVRSQIDALDSRRLLWNGELWPGQQADWEIIEGDEERPPQTGEGGSGDIPWTTRISLDLARLGPVNAVVEILGKTARIRIAASATGSSEAFARETAELRRALTAADVTVQELAVQEFPSAACPAGGSMP